MRANLRWMEGVGSQYCSDSSVRLIWASSTTRCHALVATFHFYSNIHSSVYHIRRGTLSIFPSRPTLVYSTRVRGILLCVGPHPKFISGSSLRGVVTRAVFSSGCYGFLGALAFWDTTSCPPGDSLRTFRKICDRLHHRRWQTRSRLLPDQASHDYILNFKLRARPRLDLGLVSLVLVWLLLAAPPARCS
jgi:hypothetical protein